MKNQSAWDEVYIGEIYQALRESVVRYEQNPRVERKGSYIAIYYQRASGEGKRMVSQAAYKVIYALMEGAIPSINNIPFEEQ